MSKVVLLDARISNMIAAGEVVERPSAVVKELVENAIDAGSTRIEIVIRDGGTSLIEIIDNGSGMSKEDAILAFERHATSKIKTEQDLWNIQTLGFRGEALPSIASVSEVLMTTCNGEESTAISLANGIMTSVSPAAFRQGTQIRVEQLFYTLPARLKHLKSIPYEFSLILDVVNKLALINPKIAFVLNHDDKEVFRTSGNGDMQAILYAIYGRDVAKAAVMIHDENEEFRIDGYICLPHMNRSNRYHLVTFMNDRLIKSYKLSQAIVDGYHDFIAPQRYPMAFLSIHLDHKLIDVNVHPSKWEVRLAKEQQLNEFITQAIVKTLRSNLYRSGDLLSDDRLRRSDEISLQTSSQTSLSADESNIDRNQNTVMNGTENHNNAEKFVAQQITKPVAVQLQWRSQENPVSQVVSLLNSRGEEETNASSESPVFHQKSQAFVDNNVVFGENKVEIVEKLAENVENYRVSPMTVIGQLHGSYILCQDDRGLIIIDQHAANERIRYEEVRRQLEEEQIATQPLLFPLIIPVTKSVMLRLADLLPVLQSIGLELEVFGESELVCRELPLWMNVENEERLIHDILEMLLQERTLNLKTLNKDALATLACHTSIRFNRVLSQLEMNVLINRLFACENPYHCPHGRPTMIHYDSDKLRKRFDRS